MTTSIMPSPVRWRKNSGAKGNDVHLVTTLPVVSSWTAMTDEQSFIQSRLLGMDVAHHAVPHARRASGGCRRSSAVPIPAAGRMCPAARSFSSPAGCRMQRFIRTCCAHAGALADAARHRRLPCPWPHCGCGLQRPPLCAGIGRGRRQPAAPPRTARAGCNPHDGGGRPPPRQAASAPGGAGACSGHGRCSPGPMSR